MENEVKINAIDVQKELMKSKVMAKFSHYTSGNMYYTVELESGVYQFPIGTVETGTVEEILGPCETGDIYNGGFTDLHGIYTSEEVKRFQERRKKSDEKDGILVESQPVAAQVSKLSEDLGTTNFHTEMRGSELNRWIKMAIKNDEFTKIN